MNRSRTTRSLIAATLALCARAPLARATSWWLPPNYSEHGKSVDHLFNVIFWLTSVVMVGVFGAMLYFLIRYRHNPRRRKAHFSHGNQRLEMIWTIIPAIVLTFISLYSKGVWDKYRYGETADPRKPARILVIGQQFQWNVIYAGPDNKIGKYLVYPKPSDKLWPKGRDGMPFTFSFGKYQDTRGPAEMPYEEAVTAINAYIQQENPLGKVFDDPDGKDDDFGEGLPGRPIYLPKGRPVEVQLSSKDVIHDFFLPNFRVKLDAVPGLRGVLTFVPTITSKEIEDDPANRRTFSDFDQLAKLLQRPENQEMMIAIDGQSQPKAKDAKSPGAIYDKKLREWKYLDKGGKTILRENQALTPDRLAGLRAIGVKEITVHKPGYFDLVCEELCGQGHSKMQGQVIVLTAEEFAEKFETKSEEAAASVARATSP